MNWRKAVGIVLILVGFGLLGGGWYVFAQSQSTAERSLQAWRQADQQCLTALRNAGEVQLEGALARTTMAIGDGRDWQAAMADATGLIGYCATRRLVRLCMGRGCALAATLPAEDARIPEETLASLRDAPLELIFSLREVRP